MMAGLLIAIASAWRTFTLSSGGFCVLNARKPVFRPALLIRLMSLLAFIRGRSAGFGNGITWHSFFSTLAKRTEASGVMVNTRRSSFDFPCQ
ncbi:Uncharacterised protein [Enterobacter cloacae]|nr:Uncharacterised protein [Enterobacter cloacae]